MAWLDPCLRMVGVSPLYVPARPVMRLDRVIVMWSPCIHQTIWSHYWSCDLHAYIFNDYTNDHVISITLLVMWSPCLHHTIWSHYMSCDIHTYYYHTIIGHVIFTPTTTLLIMWSLLWSKKVHTPYSDKKGKAGSVLSMVMWFVFVLIVCLDLCCYITSYTAVLVNGLCLAPIKCLVYLTLTRINGWTVAPLHVATLESYLSSEIKCV